MKLRKSQKIGLIMSYTLIFIFMFSSIALAADPGVEMGNWIQRNVAGVVVGIIAVVGLTLILTRKFMALLVYIVFVGAGSVFVYNGTEFGQKIGAIIMSWFN